MANRQIKDAKDLSTNELIYFKGHAKATYMSDGTTVEDAINNIDTSGGESDENVVKGIMTESGNINGIVLPDGRELYIGNGSSLATNSDIMYKVEPAIIGSLSEIENCFNGDISSTSIALEYLAAEDFLCYIGDEEGNICGYVTGQKVDWENGTITITILTYNGKLITITSVTDSPEIYPNQINIIDLKNGTGGSSSSGSPDSSITYFDLNSLDNVQFVDDYNNIEASGTISQEDYDTYCSAIEKNKFGIVLDGLYLHNIYTESYTATILNIYSVFYDTNSEKLKYIYVALSTDLNVYVETRIIESNNSSGSGSSVTSVKVNGVSKSPSNGVVDLGYINKQLSTSTSSSMTLSPNIYYRNTSTSLSSLTITLGSVSNSNIINEYFVEFTTSSSGTTVSLPSAIKWVNGTAPTFEAGATYQISIVNNLGTCLKFA